jgi:hypothetical protein
MSSRDAGRSNPINLSQFQPQIQETIVVKYFGGYLEVAVQPRPKKRLCNNE